MREDVAKAIKIIESSRASHESWIKWYEKLPAEEEKHRDTVGDKVFHAQCIENYDYVLSLLRNL